MSSHPIHLNGRRTALVALLAMMALVVVAALASADHPTDEDANNGGSGLSEWTGEWNVAAGDDLEYANQTISLDGTLIINNGGRLVLRNVTLILHGGELDPQEINVFDGELVITDLDDNPDSVADGSLVMADDPLIHYYFQVYEEATITVTNSHIMDCGRLFDALGIQAGLYINTNDAVIEGMEFSNNFGGIFIDGVDITVSDSIIHDNDWIGIYVVNNAAPLIEGCHVEDNLREGIVIKSQSDVELRDSWVRGNMRGILVDGAYLAAHDTSISSNTEVDLNLPYFSQVELFNCTISVSPTNTPILMENSSLTSTHGNFDIASIEMADSIFMYRQFLTVIVTWSDSQDTPIQDVPVKVEDSEDRIFNFLTDEDGMVKDVPMEVVFYQMSGLGLETTIYNPFLVTVIHNLQEQDEGVEMRYSNGLVRFQYLDTVDPTAVAPSVGDADVGRQMVLDGSGSFDNVAIEDWNWSFVELGEPVYLSGEIVNYSFKEAREYTITLTVTDTSQNSGLKSVTTFDINVRDRTSPIADAGPDQTVDQGTVVTLDGSDSTDNVGIVSYTWSFTYDGAPRSLTGMIATWKFDIPGKYAVVLRVEDAAGLTDADSMNVTVLDNIPPTTTVVFNPEMPPDRKYDQVVQIIFNVEDVGAGQVELKYRINGVVWETVVGGLALSFGGDLQYGDGVYEIEYYAVDSVGNEEEVQTIASFLVDATPPTFTNMDPPISPYPTTEETYTITGKTEPGATLTINEDTVTVAVDGSFSYPVELDVGDNAYYLHAVDAVGHTADLTRVIDRSAIDNPPPDNGGSSIIYFVGGAIIAVVLLLLVLYIFVLRPRNEEPPPM
jgi:hypothetical protein